MAFYSWLARSTASAKTQINYEKCRLQKESPVSSDTSFFLRCDTSLSPSFPRTPSPSLLLFSPLSLVFLSLSLVCCLLTSVVMSVSCQTQIREPALAASRSNAKPRHIFMLAQNEPCEEGNHKQYLIFCFCYF